jgi:putative inorganic carbon (hco3(-)) transporter
MRLAGGQSSRVAASPALVATALAASAVAGIAAARAPELTLAAAALAACVTLIVAWPEAATLLVVFLIWANIPAVLINDHGAPFVLGALVPILLAVPVVSHLIGGERLRIDRTYAFMLLFLVALILSTLATDHQAAGVERVQGFAIEGLLVYLLVINAVRTPETLRRVLWTVLLAAAFLSFVTIVQKVLGNYTSPYFGFGKVHASYFLGKSEVPRVAGPIGDPNYYAQILLVAVPLGLVSIWRERSPLLRTAAIACTAFAVVAIMLTFSRGAGLGFALVFVIMAILRYFKPSQVVAVLVGIILLLSLVPAYKDRVASVSGVGGATAAAGSDTSADLATQSRAAEMLAGVMVFIDYPVLGVGPAGFPFYYQEYAQRLGLPVHETAESGEREGLEAQRQTHNAFIGIAADLGLPGLLVFCSILGASLRDLMRARRRSLRSDPALANMATGLMLAIVSYAATAMFLTLAFERYLWLLLGLAGAASAMALRGSGPPDGERSELR